MQKLILINIESDPDKYYKEFELQQAFDEDNNESFLLIAYRNDRGVDIYHQNNYPFSSASSVFAVPNLIERDMEDAVFEIDNDKMEMRLSLTDKYGRIVELSVLEKQKNKKKPFSILAPVGAGSENPLSLPVYLLYEMSFARRAYTDVKVKIDGVTHKPSTMPLPVNCARNYFIRYSADTFIVDWNRNYNGFIKPLDIVGNNLVDDQGIKYKLIQNSGNYEIEALGKENEKHQLRIDFYPPIPDLSCLKDGLELEGEFEISAEKSIGIIKGVYIINTQENKISISMCPSEGWKANEKKISLKILYLLGPFFKKWPSTFTWEVEFDFSNEKKVYMKSSWKRKEGWKKILSSGIFKIFD